MDTASRARDEWIALRCQAGESEAFEDLVHVMERPLLYYAAKLLRDQEQALEALQDVWIRVFRGIKRLQDPGSLRPWLYRVTRGIVIDRIRQDASRQKAEEVYAEGFSETDEPTFDDVDAGAVHQALDQLDLRLREALVLHFLEDFSVAEIAAAIGCPEGTVKSRIYYAKKAMKEILSGGGYGIQ